ncbi:fatty acid CoA ligase family protein [Streptomyces vinaceus]|uniref:fatty acid CoA ligase family protein n=1 Tax=Streptomyces vinaceus TaxID=1960 RepID=UPI0038026919
MSTVTTLFPVHPAGGVPDADGLAGILERHARDFPHKPAVVHPVGTGRVRRRRPVYRTLSYGRLQSTVEELAAGLNRAGISKGTRTVLMAPPGPELFALAFALFRVGAVPVVVDPGMGLRRMLHCYRSVGAEAFIGPPVAHLVRVLGRGSFSSINVSVTLGRYGIGRTRSLTAVRALGAAAEPAGAAACDEDLLMIGFTTGSTGPAKGVEYTHRMALAISRSIEAVHGRTSDDISLVTLPFYGILDLVYGSTLVLAPLAPSRVAQADPELLVDALERFSVTTMFASPALLGPLASYLSDVRPGRHPLPDLRCVVGGGAPVPDSTVAALRRVLDEKARVHVTYGATEALPIASIEAEELVGSPERETAGAPGTDGANRTDGTATLTAQGAGTCVGRPVPGTEVAVLSVTDGPLTGLSSAVMLPSGETGEIIVRGESVSRGYHRSPAANRLHKIPGSTPGAAPWHRTGDLGRLDGEGRLWFCGRASQRVRAEGGDLYTVSCEGIFNAHPMVRRTALVGVPGEDGSKTRPVVCVETLDALDEAAWVGLRTELRALAAAHAPTQGLREFLRHPGFPVDVRHNAKIGREELGRWAERRLAPPPPWYSLSRADRIVPLAGWAYLVGGAAWAAFSGVPEALLPRLLWWTDAVLSVVGHAVQLRPALSRARAAGVGRPAAVGLTMLFGATWWRKL